MVPLRELARPYILRRLKTDKTIIADLPDKTEVKAFCPLRPQASCALPADGGGAHCSNWRTSMECSVEAIVLAYLMRLKQICNLIPRSGSATAHGLRRTAVSSDGCATSPK